MQRVTSLLPSWDRTKTGSKQGFDKVWGWADKLGAPVNKLTNKIGSEAFWPMTLDKECDKAARILRSFCKDGFYAEEKDRYGSPTDGPNAKAKQRVLKKIPEKVIKNAVGLAIFTTMRSGLWISGAGGSGILIARTASGDWSPPSGILLHTAGLGFLVGVDIYDCVLVINNRETLQSFTKMRATLGGEISVVAGPVGAGGILENDGRWKQMNKPVFTYLKSRGFYAGVQVDGTVVIERSDENERFYGERIGVEDILAGKARHPPYEIKMLMETVKSAEGRNDVDKALMDELAEQPAPGDVQLDSPTAPVPEGPIFGVPEPDDPDPFGVIALEQQGLLIKEAGTNIRPDSSVFEYKPAPTSPLYGQFLHRRMSLDTNVSRNASQRTSYLSYLSTLTTLSEKGNGLEQLRGGSGSGRGSGESRMVECGTQTDDEAGSSPHSQVGSFKWQQRVINEDGNENLPPVPLTINSSLRPRGDIDYAQDIGSPYSPDEEFRRGSTATEDGFLPVHTASGGGQNGYYGNGVNEASGRKWGNQMGWSRSSSYDQSAESAYTTDDDAYLQRMRHITTLRSVPGNMNDSATSSGTVIANGNGNGNGEGPRRKSSGWGRNYSNAELEIDTRQLRKSSNAGTQVTPGIKDSEEARRKSSGWGRNYSNAESSHLPPNPMSGLEEEPEQEAATATHSRQSSHTPAANAETDANVLAALEKDGCASGTDEPTDEPTDEESGEDEYVYEEYEEPVVYEAAALAAPYAQRVQAMKPHIITSRGGGTPRPAPPLPTRSPRRSVASTASGMSGVSPTGSVNGMRRGSPLVGEVMRGDGGFEDGDVDGGSGASSEDGRTPTVEMRGEQSMHRGSVGSMASEISPATSVRGMKVSSPLVGEVAHASWDDVDAAPSQSPPHSPPQSRTQRSSLSSEGRTPVVSHRPSLIDIPRSRRTSRQLGVAGATELAKTVSPTEPMLKEEDKKEIRQVVEEEKPIVMKDEEEVSEMNKTGKAAGVGGAVGVPRSLEKELEGTGEENDEFESADEFEEGDEHVQVHVAKAVGLGVGMDNSI